jgi:putative ABC transport system permease protein
MIETLVQDLRYGLRTLANNPSFTAVTVITLALGIAANTTIFSLLSGVLLRKAPVRDPDRVTMILSTGRAEGWDQNLQNPSSAPDFVAWRDGNHVFENMAATDPWKSFSLTGEGHPERIPGSRVSANYFDVLGVSAALGRTFLPGEDQPGRGQVVILSHELWKNRYDSDPQVMGKTLKLDGRDHTIIGIMPEAFKLWIFPARVWIPLVFSSDQLGPKGRESWPFYVFGRLKAGTTRQEAQAEMTTLVRHLGRDYAETDKDWEAMVLSLQEFQIRYARVRAALLLLMGAVGFVLLIVCANVAGLLLARAAARQHEMAVRAALGASRVRLIRQLLSESFLMALLGGAMGVLLAWWGIKLLHAGLNFNDLVKTMEFGIDPQVLVFTLGVSLLTVMLFGLFPALQASKPNLKEGGRTGTSGKSASRMWRLLVIGQMASALVLLTGAGLMINAFLEEVNVDPGFNRHQLVTANLSLPSSRYPSSSKRAAFFQQVLGQVQNLPAVRSVALTGSLPLAAEAGMVPFSIEEQPSMPTQRPQARYYVVSSGYFSTMEIPLIEGRTFTDFDDANAPPVALVNQAFVRRFFPRGNALGQHISLDPGLPRPGPGNEIVGAVGNVKDWSGQPGHDPQIYESYLQSPSASATLVARTRLDPGVLAPGLRRALWSVDKDQPLDNVMTMAQVMNGSGEGGDRLMGQLLGIFAGLALVLAVVGIYGIVAYSVTQRTHELGIRMALGAESRDVLKLVLGEGARLSATGLALGLGASLLLPRLLASAFTGFYVQAAPVFLIVSGLVAGGSVLASYVPARRASKVDPMVALRCE